MLNVSKLCALLWALRVPFLAPYRPVNGIVELTEAMPTASTLQELFDADGEHEHDKETSRTIRERLLQEAGVEDSEPILADYFGGEPGFYHGLASGKFLCHCSPSCVQFR